MHYQQNDKYTEMHGQQNLKKPLSRYFRDTFVSFTHSTNRDGRVGIATSFRLDGQGFESQTREEILSFLKESSLDLVRTKTPHQLGSGRGVKLNTPSGADV